MSMGKPCCSAKDKSSLEVVILDAKDTPVSGIMPEFFDVKIIHINGILVNDCGCG